MQRLMYNCVLVRSIVVIVMFNKAYKGWFDTYKVLREAYAPIFGTLVFTGFKDRPKELAEEEHWVTCDAWDGNLQYACFANAIEVCFALFVHFQGFLSNHVTALFGAELFQMSQAHFQGVRVQVAFASLPGSPLQEALPN